AIDAALEAQVGVERRRHEVAHAERAGEARVAAERLREAEHLVEGRRDEAAVDAARWPLVGRAEAHAALGRALAGLREAHRGRERVREADQRALVEEGPDVAGVRRLRAALEVAQPRAR